MDIIALTPVILAAIQAGAQLIQTASALQAQAAAGNTVATPDQIAKLNADAAAAAAAHAALQAETSPAA